MKIRGFEICKGYENSAIIPKRKTSKSAGYDFYLPTYIEIKPKQTVFIKTGTKAYMKDDEVLQIYIRSSVGTKLKVRNGNCVCIIDSDYYNNNENEGNIILALYNYGDKTQLFRQGDRVCQGIFTKYLLSDNDNTTETRNGGIGSTGVK